MRGLVRVGLAVLVVLWILPFEIVPALEEPIREAIGPQPWTIVSELCQLILSAQEWVRGDGLVPSVVAGIVLAAAWAISSFHRAGDDAPAPAPAGPRTVRGLVVNVEFTNTWVGDKPLFVVTVTHPGPNGMSTSVAPLAAPAEQAPFRGGSVMVTPVAQSAEVTLAPDPYGLHDPDGSLRYAAPGVWR